MNNKIRTSIVSAALLVSPLASPKSNDFLQGKKQPNNTKSELFINFADKPADNTDINIDKNHLEGIDSKIITNAILDYYTEEVKLYKLSSKAREKLTQILNLYLSSHSVLKIGNNGEVQFIIEDKEAFSQMVKDFANVVIADMPFLVRKVAIPLFFGGSDALQQKLDNLDSTIMNLKEKQYKDMVFDYVAGIVKRVVGSVNGNMEIGNYYSSISKYYPNKYSNKIGNEVAELGLKGQDIKNLEYPFKK